MLIFVDEKSKIHFGRIYEASVALYHRTGSIFEQVSLFLTDRYYNYFVFWFFCETNQSYFLVSN